MPNKSIRWAVFHEERRASRWHCWSGKDQSIYLGCRGLGALHASFHPKGECHIGFDEPRFPSVFREGDQPESRFSGRWIAPAPILNGWRLAAEIYTPMEALTIVDPNPSSKVVKVQGPPSFASSEVRLYYGPKAGKDDEWLSSSVNTFRVGSFEMQDVAVVVLARTVVPRQRVNIPTYVEPRYFAKAGPDSVVGEQRMSALAWDPLEEGGTVRFFEEAVLVKRSAGPATTG